MNSDSFSLQIPVAAVAVWGIFGLLALTEPDFLLLLESDLQTFIRHAFDLLMPSVTERLFFAQSAGAPGNGFTGLYLYTAGFVLGRAGKSFIGNRIHVLIFF